MLTKSTRGLSLTSLLIDQGSLFLVAMALPNFVGIGLGKIPVLEANIPLHNEVTTSILISRFILTLRTQRSLPDTTEDLEGSTVTFASMSTLRTNAMEPAYQGSEPVTTTIYSTI
ncbi:hypothetical protein BDY19DRAFT_698807 [Irpex rosettiformis]|uniref:Uncharacterized protein n=1 Tax=Irpex rosettiformis TaxID=378272 RepID=A0ACB8UAR7_9APHY|nr:hypothetical protein BDY19DRAFT_698807 [Irpex rosettiformis]